MLGGVRSRFALKKEKKQTESGRERDRERKRERKRKKTENKTGSGDGRWIDSRSWSVLSQGFVHLPIDLEAETYLKHVVPTHVTSSILPPAWDLASLSYICPAKPGQTKQFKNIPCWTLQCKSIARASRIDVEIDRILITAHQKHVSWCHGGISHTFIQCTHGRGSGTEFLIERAETAPKMFKIKITISHCVY